MKEHKDIYMTSKEKVIFWQGIPLQEFCPVPRASLMRIPTTGSAARTVNFMFLNISAAASGMWNLMASQ